MRNKNNFPLYLAVAIVFGIFIGSTLNFPTEGVLFQANKSEEKIPSSTTITLSGFSKFNANICGKDLKSPRTNKLHFLLKFNMQKNIIDIQPINLDLLISSIF